MASEEKLEPCMRPDPDDPKVTCGLPLGHEGFCSWDKRRGHGIALEFYAPPMTPIQVLKQELLALAGSGCREDFKLVEAIFEELPELRNV